MTSIDWTAVKIEYISTKISYRALAEKHGISLYPLKEKAKKENWTELRKKHQNKVYTKATQKIQNKQVKSEASRIEAINIATDKILENIMEALSKIKTINISGDVTELRQLIICLKYITDIHKALDTNDTTLEKLDSILEQIGGNI